MPTKRKKKMILNGNYENFYCIQRLMDIIIIIVNNFYNLFSFVLNDEHYNCNNFYNLCSSILDDENHHVILDFFLGGVI